MEKNTLKNIIEGNDLNKYYDTVILLVKQLLKPKKLQDYQDYWDTDNIYQDLSAYIVSKLSDNRKEPISISWTFPAHDFYLKPYASVDVFKLSDEEAIIDEETVITLNNMTKMEYTGTYQYENLTVSIKPLCVSIGNKDTGFETTFEYCNLSYTTEKPIQNGYKVTLKHYTDINVVSSYFKQQGVFIREVSKNQFPNSPFQDPDIRCSYVIGLNEKDVDNEVEKEKAEKKEEKDSEKTKDKPKKKHWWQKLFK